jgi:hypothetical protein
VVPGPRPIVFEYLADLRHHWTLADRFEVLRLDGEPALGGVVRLRGPLGFSREAATRVEEVHAPRTLAGTATIGRRTAARVCWALEDRDGTTAVTLEAIVLRAGALDALVLQFGGRRWLQRRFVRVLQELADRFVERQSLPHAA